MALETIPRPPIYQTYVPFVEMYINGVDILRSADGKPRTLISFTHDRWASGTGQWTLELFDPSYVAVEELLFATTDGSLGEVAEDVYEGSGGQIDKELTHPAMFRYGYVSADGKVLATSPEGDEFFFGSVLEYTPTYQTNGTMVTITGQSMGFAHARMPKLKRSFYNKSIYEIIKLLCDEMEWTLVPLGWMGGDTELPPEKQPEAELVPNAAIDTTEEQPARYSMGEDEDVYAFICRLADIARSTDPKYNNYTCYLEYYTEGRFDGSTSATPTEPKGYLFFGPGDVFATPVRKYVYMRDSESDVISFSPHVAVNVASVSGLVGMVHKVDNARAGEHDIHITDATNQDQKLFRTRRATLSFQQMAQFQEGVPEQGDETLNRPEGGVGNESILAPVVPPDVDAPVTEISSHETEPLLADRHNMAWWLAMHQYVNTASLEIFGDPSPEITIESNVLVVFTVPTGEGGAQEYHWTTQVWTIKSVQHSIRDGMFTTQLGLMANSTITGGISSRAAWRALNADTGGMKKTGA